ncbi:MAG TPA: M1 family metallopeptidase [Sphingomicrobium sp.]|nr:M1 family metallopeptidase [Sphingomicrobium sp.]
MVRIFAFAAALLLAACQAADSPADEAPAPKERIVAPILDTRDAVDTHSYAKPLEARVANVDLDLALDFDAKRVAGTAALDIIAKPGIREVVLDSNGLQIAKVTDAAGKPLQHKLGASDEAKGAPLTVALSGDGEQRIVIHYASAPNAAALQWLSPEQTAGKKQPYLFSQGQPTLNRTWIPTQDSPGVRQTWSAKISAPAPIKVVMSGDRLTPDGEPAGEGRRSYRFRMDKPVAPYLIAIAAGDLAFRKLGARTGVWTEPAMLDKAAAELADTERMVEAAEKLYGPYRWGRYDIVVLPPAFPYGGMENPTLTFLTPTFIAGDKSLNGLVAHELAHSWSGNLVTNATWADSWLNEGFTSYFENRIMEAIYGKRRAAQEAALSFDEVGKALEEEGATSAKTRLNLTAEEGTPEGGSSGIIYDKGAVFLRTLEQGVGRERWDAYLRSYFDRHAFQPMTSARFLADLRARLIKGDAALEEKLKLDQWVYQPGLLDNVARPDPAAFAAVDQAVTAYTAGGPPPADFARWTTAEKLRFIGALPRTMPKERLAELDQRLGLNRATNNEVLFAWLELAVANRYDPAVPTLERFLAAMGRRKFVMPLFKALAEDKEWGLPIARRIYPTVRPLYHAVTYQSVDELNLL